MAVASSIELNDVGMWRSLDELEVDRRDDSDVFEGVRDRLSLRMERFREPRFGGITTGLEFEPRISVLDAGREAERTGVNGFMLCSRGFCGSAEVKRNALGTIMMTTVRPTGDSN